MKYINAFANPELFPINKSEGKRQYHEFKEEEAKRMKDVLIDPSVLRFGKSDNKNKLKTRYKDVLIPPEKLKIYEEKLEKAYDKEELNKRMRSISQGYNKLNEIIYRKSLCSTLPHEMCEILVINVFDIIFSANPLINKACILKKIFYFIILTFFSNSLKMYVFIVIN